MTRHFQHKHQAEENVSYKRDIVSVIVNRIQEGSATREL